MGSHSFPCLGFDPCPGEVSGTQEEARALNTAAELLRLIVNELTNADSSGWKGRTADAMRAHLEHDVIPLYRKAMESFTEAAAVHQSWVDQLAEFQRRADVLERRAAEAQRNMASATGAVHAFDDDHHHIQPAGDTYIVAEASTGQPDPAARSAVSRLETAHADTQAVHQEAGRLHHEYLSSARRLSGRLNTAGDMAPKKPGFWDSFGHSLAGDWHSVTNTLGEAGDWAAHLGEESFDWVKDHAGEIGDLMGDLAAFCAVAGLAIAWIPGVDLLSIPLEAIAGGLEVATMITSGLALGFHVWAMSDGDKDIGWEDIAMDVAGMAFPAGGKAIEGGIDSFREARIAAKVVGNFGEASRILVGPMHNLRLALDLGWWGDKVAGAGTLAYGAIKRSLHELNPMDWGHEGGADVAAASPVHAVAGNFFEAAGAGAAA